MRNVTRELVPHRWTRRALGASTAIALVGSLTGVAHGQVTADGRSATTITQAGSTSNVHTQTISQGHGINSFSSFNVGAGASVNIHAPAGTAGTVNIVNGSASQIHGAVRGMQNGAVGGAMYFANPNGVVIGPSGSMSAGSVSVSTPSQNFVDGYFDGNGQVRAGHVRQTIDGTSPQSGASVDVHGRVEGYSGVRIRAGGNVNIWGEVVSGSRSSVAEGHVSLKAGGIVNINRGGRVDARSGAAGGTVSMRAGADINVHAGSVVLAEGEGHGGGGTIDVFAEGAARLARDAVVSAAALGTGDGGFIEFSATDLVQVAGDLRAYSAGGGAGGTIYIDPNIVEVLESQNTNGADLHIEALERITVGAGVVISTRQVAPGADHEAAASTGASGDIHLEAPNIDILDGAALYAHVQGTQWYDQGPYHGGTIFLDAHRIDSNEGNAIDDAQNAAPIGSVSITIVNAKLLAGNIDIKAEILKDNVIRADDSVNTYAESVADWLPVGADKLTQLAEGLGEDAQQLVEELGLEEMPQFLSATSNIVISGSKLIGQGRIDVQAIAATEVDLAPENGTVSLAVAATNTVARTVVQDSVLYTWGVAPASGVINTEGTVSVGSTVRETHNLVATSNVVDGENDDPPVNVAIALSARRALAETIVDGFPTQDIRANWPAPNPESSAQRYPVLWGMNGVSVTAEKVENITLRADAVTNADTKGAAIALSLSDSDARVVIGAQIADYSSDIEVRAQHTVENFTSIASVSGGTLASAPADGDENEAIDEADRVELAGTLEAVSSKVADAVSDDGDGTGDESTAGNRFGVAFNLSMHDYDTRVLIGPGAFTYVDPVTDADRTTGTGALRAIVGYPGIGNTFTGYLDGTPGIRVQAINDFGSPVVRSVVSLGGSTPDDDDAGVLTGLGATELENDGERVYTGAFNLAWWDADASVALRSADAFISREPIFTIADVTIEARNSFDTHMDAGELGDLWSDYVDAAKGDGADGASAIERWGSGDGLFLADGEAERVMFDARAEGMGSELGLGLSATILSLDLTAAVDIGDGFEISNSTLGYSALGAASASDIADASTLRIGAVNEGDVIVSAGAPGVSSGGGEKGGYGGALSIADLDGTADVTIGEDHDIRFAALEAEASQDVAIVNRARSFGQNGGGGTAFNAGVALTFADLATGATIGGSGDIAIDGRFALAARDSSSFVTVAGSGNTGGGNALGFGVALNVIDRQTVAMLAAHPSGQPEPWEISRLDAKTIEITADIEGHVIASGSASATAGTEGEAPVDGEDEDVAADEGTVEIGTNLLGDKADKIAPSTGAQSVEGKLSVSGDLAGNFVDATTLAALNDREIYNDIEDSFTIRAHNTTAYGQASAVSAVATDGVGISGSFGLSAIVHATTARLAGTTINTTEDGEAEESGTYLVLADDQPVFGNLVIGRSGSADGSWGLAISAAFNSLVSVARTEVVDSMIAISHGYVGRDYVPPDEDWGEGEGGEDGEGEGGWEEEEYELQPWEIAREEALPTILGGAGFILTDNMLPINVDGRDITISAVSAPVSTVTAIAARDTLGREASGDEQMGAVTDMFTRAGDASKEEGEGRKGVSITISPSLVSADAEVLVANSYIQADRPKERTWVEDWGDYSTDYPLSYGPRDTEGRAGKLEVLSRATTTVSIDATSDTIGAAVAITETHSAVRLRDAVLDAEGNSPLTVRSTAEEIQDIQSRVGDQSRWKATGVLSLRNLSNRVLIDAEEGFTDGSSLLIGGQDVTVEAVSNHDIELQAIAADGSAIVLGIAAVVSLGDSDTEAAVGGDIEAADGDIVIAARETWAYDATAIVMTGSEAGENDAEEEPGDGEEEGNEEAEGDSNLMASLKDLSDDQEERVTDEADGTAGEDKGKASRKASFAIGLNIERHDSAARVVIGGTRTDENGANVTLAGPRITNTLLGRTPAVQVVAETAIETFRKLTQVRAGSSGETETQTSLGGAGVLSLGIWDVETTALLGAGAQAVGLGSLSVKADTSLPSPDIQAFRDAFAYEHDDALFDPEKGELEAGDLVARPRDLIAPENWNVVNESSITEGNAAVAIDVAVHMIDLDTRAEVADGATVDAIDGTLSVSAANSGSLIVVRREAEPVEALEEAETGGGFGAGVQYTRVRSGAIADLGAIEGETDEPAAIGAVAVSARNDLAVVSDTVSFGAVENIAFNAAVSIVDYSGTTHARVSDGADLAIAGALAVRATDSSLIYAHGSAGSSGDKAAIGLAGALVFADRSTRAAITALPLEALGQGEPIADLGTTIAAGSIDIEATNEGGEIASSSAGMPVAEADDEGGGEGEDDDAELPQEDDEKNKKTIPTKLLGNRATEYSDELDRQETPEEADDTEAEGGTFGFQLSADFAGVFSKHAATAAMETAAIVNVAGAVAIAATQDTVSLTASGATIAGAAKIGLAGSGSFNVLDREIGALVRGVTLDAGGAVSVSATNSETAVAMSAGRSEAPSSFSLLGSAAVILLDADVSASIDESDVTAGALSVSAQSGADDAAPKLLAIAGAVSAEVVEEAAEGVEDPQMPEGTEPPVVSGEDGEGGDGEGDEEGSGGVAIGVAFGAVIATQSIVAGTVDTAIAADKVELTAANRTNAGTLAASNGAAEDVGVAASVVVNVATFDTRALLGPGDVDVATTITITATDEGSNRGRIGTEAEGQDAAFGGSALVIVDRRDVIAGIDGTAQQPTGGHAPAIAIDAANTVTVDAFQKSGFGAEEGIAGGVMVGHVETHWLTRAGIAGSGFGSAGQVGLSASEDALVRNRQGSDASGDGFAGNVGVTTTFYNSDVVAIVEDSLVVSTSALEIDAESRSTLSSRAVINGDAENAVGGLFAFNRGRGEIFAGIVDSEVEVGSVAIGATDATIRDLVANSAATVDSVGISGGLAIDLYGRHTIAEVRGGSLATGGNVSIDALSEGSSTTTVIGKNMGGGSFAGTAQLTWTQDDRDVIARIDGAAIDVDGDVSISAERTDTYLSLIGTYASSASAVGLGAGILLTGGDTSAIIDQPAVMEVGGDVALTARNAITAFNVAVGAASTDSLSLLGSVAYLELGRRPADALVLEPDADERGEGDRENANVARDEAAEEIAAQTGLASAADLKTARDVRTRAVIELAGSGEFAVGGDVDLLATDARRGFVIAGQLGLSLPGVGAAGDALMDLVKVEREPGGTFQVSLMPLPAEAEEGEEEPADEPAEPEEQDVGADEDSEAISDYEEGTEGEDEGGNGGVAIGASVAWVKMGGLVESRVDLASDAHLDVDGDLSADARGNASTLALAVGGAPGGDVAIGGSAAISVQNQFVVSGVAGDGTISARNITIDAENDGKSWTFAGVLQQAGEFALGLTLTVNDVETQTQARVHGADIEAGQGVSIEATDSSRSLSLAFAAGASTGGPAANFTVGYSRSRAHVSSLVDAGASIIAGGDVALLAERDQKMHSFVFAVSAGSSAAVSGSLAVANQKGTAEAIVRDSTIISNDDDVIVDARSRAGLITAAAGVGASTGTSITGSVAISLKSDTVRAIVEDSDIEAGDSVLVQAVNGGALDGVGGGDVAQLTGGVSFGTSAGVGVSVSLLKTSSVVEAAILGSSTVFARGTASSDGVSSIRRRDEAKRYLDREDVVRRGVNVIADNETHLRTLALTVAASTGVSISLQVPILLVEDTVSARIAGTSAANRPDVGSSTDVNVFAGNQTDIVTTSLVGAVGSTAGIGADVEVFSIRKSTLAEIDRASVVAKRDVSVQAVTPESIRTLSLAGSVGLSVGVSGIVQVGFTQSETQARIARSTVVADQDLFIDARAPRKLVQTAGTAAGGTVGIGASVLVLNSRDRVIAEAANGTTLAGNHADLDVGRDIAVTADATMYTPDYEENELPLNQTVIGLGGGAVAISGSLLVTKFQQTVEARIGSNAKVDHGRLDNVTVDARQSFTQNVFMGTAVGGVVAIGGSVFVGSMTNAVLAEIGNGASVEAGNNITVNAYGERNFTGGAVAAGGGLGAFTGAALILSFGSPGDVEETRGNVDAVGGDLEGDPFSTDDGDVSAGDPLLGSLLGEATASRQSVNLSEMYSGAQEDTIRARIGSAADVDAGNALAVTSGEGGSLTVYSGGFAGGYVGGAAAIAIVKRGSIVETIIGADADLHGTNSVTISSIADVDDGSPSAVAGSGGVVSGNAAVADINIGRRVTVSVGAGADISSGLSGTIEIAAREVGETRAQTVSVVGGVVAIGASVARAQRTSVVEVLMAGSGPAPRIVGDSISISASRLGQVYAMGIGAAGGVVAGTGVSALARDTSRVTVDLGKVFVDTVGGSLNVVASNAGNVEAQGIAGATGGAAAGISLARAEREAEAEVVGDGFTLYTGNVDILAVDAASTDEEDESLVTARSIAAAVGLGASSGSKTDVVNASAVRIDFANHSIIETDLRIEAFNNSRLLTRSLGVSAGVVANGANLLFVTNDTEATVRLADGIIESQGGDVAILAGGRDDIFANSVSGSGGFISVFGALAELDVDVTTRIDLDGGMIAGGDIAIATDRDIVFETNATSAQATFAGGAGSFQSTDVVNVNRITVGTDITGNDIVIGARNQITKLADGYNGESANIGVASVSALGSFTTIENDTRVDFGAVSITQLAPVWGDADGGVGVTIHNLYDVADRMRINAVGGVPLPRADSRIVVTAPNASVAFAGTDVYAEGDIAVSSRNDAAMVSEVQVTTAGLSGAAQGTSRTVYEGDHRITVGGDTSLLSRRGNVVLEVGRDRSGNQTIAHFTETRLRNNTAVPIPVELFGKAVFDAHAEIDQVNRIVIGADADLTAALDVELTATRGNTDPYAFGDAIDGYRAVAEAVVNFVGDVVGAEDVSLSYNDQTSIDRSDNGVIVEGAVTAGAYREMTVRFRENGTVEATEEFDYALIDDEPIAGDFAARIAFLEDALDQYPEPSVRVVINAEIARLEAQLAQLGDLGGTTDFIEVDDIFASGGNIRVVADYLKGAGDLTAYGDAKIEITNETARSLRVGDLTIPFASGGEIFFNTVSVETNAQVNALNIRPGGVPLHVSQLDLEAVSSDDNEPRITITGTHVRDGTGDPRSDIFIYGVVENLTGSVNVSTSDANIYVFGGEIDARTVNIQSGGDFFVASAEPVYNTTGDPLGIYADYFAQVETIERLNRIRALTGQPLITLPEFELRESQGAVKAVGGVYIYANVINVNGLIQSGITDWTLDIDASIDARLAGQDFGGNRVRIYGPTLDADESQIGREISSVTGEQFIEGNVTVWYNPLTGGFEIDPMRTVGGYVELVGGIISTGNGQIRAAHGYGRVNVESGSDRPVTFSVIDTGGEDGVEGFIRIIDTHNVVEQIWEPVYSGKGIISSYRLADEVFLETIYRLNGNGDIVIARNDNDFTYSFQGQSGSTYEIARPYALTYNAGQTRGVERTSTRVDTFRLIGSDSTEFEGSTTSFGPLSTLTNEDRAKIPDLGIFTNAELANNPYKYTYSEQETAPVPVDGWVEVDRRTYLSVDGLLKRDITYERVERYDQLQLHQHRLAANYDIDIGFNGHETSALNITAGGDVRFERTVINQGGNTSIESTGGSVLMTSETAVLNVGNATLRAAGDIGGAAISPARLVTVGGTVDGVLSNREVNRRQLTGSALVGKAALGGASLGSDLQPIDRGGDRAIDLIIGGSVSPTTLGLINLSDDASLSAFADGSIMLRETQGDLTVFRVDAGGDVRLEAAGSILGYPLNTGILPTHVSGTTIDLLAQGGTIGSQATPLRVDVRGALKGSAAFDVDIVQRNGDLRVEGVQSLGGDVRLAAENGSITDVNTEERVDRRAVAGLLEAMWDDLGLRADDPGKTGEAARRLEQAIGSIVGKNESEYKEYWRNRLVLKANYEFDPDSGGEVFVGYLVADVLDYDPGFQVEFSSDERAGLLADGMSEAEIAALEIAKTQRFHDLHESYGALGYDADYAYVPSEAETDAATEGLYFTTAQLAYAINADVVLGTSDTQLTIEAPNVVGRDVTLAASNSIGRSLEPLVLLAGEDIDLDARLALFSAERQDISYDKDGNIVIRRQDDIDVEAARDLWATAGGDIYIGSEGVMNLGVIDGGEDVRLYSATGITNADAKATNVFGRDIVLEAGTGSIGSAESAIAIDMVPAGSVSARADGDIWLRSAASNIRVDEIFSTGVTSIAADGGSILSVHSDGTLAIRTDSLLLSASGNIGTPATPLHVLLDGEDRVLTAIAGGNIGLGIAGGDLLLLPNEPDKGLPPGVTIAAGGNVRLIADGAIHGAGIGAPDIVAGGVLVIEAIGAVGGDAPLHVQATGIGLDVEADGEGNSEARLLSDGNIGVGPIQMAGDSLLSLATVNGAILFNTDGSITARTMTFDARGANGSVNVSGDVLLRTDAATITTTQNLNVATAGTLASLGDLTLRAGLSGSTASLLARGAVLVEGDLTATARAGLTMNVVQATGEADLNSINGDVNVADGRAGTFDVLATAGAIGGAYGAIERVAMRAGAIGAHDEPVVIGKIGAGDALAVELTATTADIVASLIAGEAYAVDRLSSAGAIEILAEDADVEIAANKVDADGDIVIEAGNLLIGTTMTSANGNISLASTGVLAQTENTAITAGGTVSLMSGGQMRLARVVSGSNAIAAIDIDATGRLIAVGGETHLETAAAGGIQIDAAEIGAESGLGFSTRTASLGVRSVDGDIHMHNTGDLMLQGATLGGGLIDVVATGDLRVQGTVGSRDAANGAYGDVVLTSTGGDLLTSGFRLEADRAWFTALNGRIGGLGAGQRFVVDNRPADRMNFVARDDVFVQSTGFPFVADYVFSLRGDIDIVAEDGLYIDMTGSPQPATLASSGPIVATNWSDDATLDTLPLVGDLLVPEHYVKVTVGVAPDPGDGDPGSGDPGGGDPGGGDPGGEDPDTTERESEGRRGSISSIIRTNLVNAFLDPFGTANRPQVQGGAGPQAPGNNPPRTPGGIRLPNLAAIFGIGGGRTDDEDEDDDERR